MQLNACQGLPQKTHLQVTVVYALQRSLKRPFMMQGLLAATNAAIRAAQKRAQTERPRLQSRARQGKLQAALIDAQTAAAVAQQLIQGQYLNLPWLVCLMWRTLLQGFEVQDCSSFKRSAADYCRLRQITLVATV